MRLVSSSVAAANRAGRIVRGILKTDSLGVLDKVFTFVCFVGVVFLLNFHDHVNTEVHVNLVANLFL